MIKKSDDNLLNEDDADPNDQTLGSERLEDMSCEITETTNLMDNSDEAHLLKSESSRHKQAAKAGAIASIFSSDSNQYSLLNTKIAEESEEEADSKSRDG